MANYSPVPNGLIPSLLSWNQAFGIGGQTPVPLPQVQPVGPAAMDGVNAVSAAQASASVVFNTGAPTIPAVATAPGIKVDVPSPPNIQPPPDTTGGGGAKSGGGTGSQVASGIGMGLMIGQAIASAYGAYKGAKTLSYVAKKNEEIAKAQAGTAQLGAEMAYRAGESQISRITQRAAQLKAKQRVAMAANGVAIGVGNSAEYLASTDIGREVDKWTAESNALAQAFGYKTRSTQALAQADIESNNSRYNRSMAPVNGAMTLMNNLGSTALLVADRWATFGGATK